MIKVFVKNDCQKCERVTERLRDMVLAHEVINIEQNSETAYEPKDLPVIEDEGKVYSGSGKLDAYFEKLAEFQEDWERFQSDVCYIDKDGNVYCTE